MCEDPDPDQKKTEDTVMSVVITLLVQSQSMCAVRVGPGHRCKAFREKSDACWFPSNVIARSFRKMKNKTKQNIAVCFLLFEKVQQKVEEKWGQCYEVCNWRETWVCAPANSSLVPGAHTLPVCAHSQLSDHWLLQTGVWAGRFCSSRSSLAEGTLPPTVLSVQTDRLSRWS